MKYILMTITMALLTLSTTWRSADMEVLQPAQPLTGPGGQEYSHKGHATIDNYAKETGYYIYMPVGPNEEPQESQVIVFFHGYGAINPMLYGAWLNHLVRRGNIVIYPRYQNKILGTRTDAFVPNVQIALKDAFNELEEKGVSFDRKKIIYTGHSYGGSLTGYIAVNYSEMGLEKPKAVFMCEPGTGPFKGTKLETYKEIPSDVNTLIMVGDNDLTVGQSLGLRMFTTAVNVENINLVWQFRDKHGEPSISASHYEPQSWDSAFDNGINNLTTKRARKTTKLDAVDFYGYWKLFDALIDYSIEGKNREYCFDGGAEQTYMGKWTDGTPLKPLMVFTTPSQLKLD